MVPVVIALLLALQEAAPPPPAAYALTTRDYSLGADDVLRITVFGLPELTQELTVESDGSFDFPLIGRVQTGDRTPRELEELIAARLARGFVRDPQVRVAVQLHRSRTVSVLGELARPGSYPLTEGRTVADVLSRAGPLLPAAGAEVVVTRRSAGGGPGEVIRVDLQRLQSGEAGQDIALRPRDTVFVPRAPRIFVSGEVREPGQYGVVPGMTVRQAVSVAGGFAKSASRDRVRVLRTADGRTTEISAGLEDPVQAGDTLVVEKKKSLF